MHRALEIPEVLRRICSHIALVEVGSGYIHVDLLDESKTALAQIARTSKGLSKHALDELWMTQDTLENLLKCMQGLWDASTGNPLRPLLREDIERVNHYACRVKYFPCLEPDDLTTFARVLGHFRAALGDDLLFPNLRSLRIVFGTSAILSEISTLLSPKLKYIELGIFEEDSDYSLLPTISSACPLLTHVSISEADRSDGKHLGLWSEFICGLHHLQFAACMPVDYAALKHLAHWQLPLKQITITHMTAEAIAALERSEDPAAWELPEDDAARKLAEEERFRSDVDKFRSLKTLGIASDATCIAEFFRAWTDSASGYLDASLEDIDFDIFPSPTYESLREVYCCLSDIEPGQSFTSLAISVPLPPPQRDISETTPERRETCLLDHFRCLESCRLSILNLTPPDNYEFGDYDVRCLGKFCYYLTSVTLHRARGPYPPLATVNALITLAERCRFLTTLVLSINVQTEDIEEFFKEYEQPPVEEISVPDEGDEEAKFLHSFGGRLEPKPVNVQLIEWDVGSSFLPQDAIVGMASILTEIFPFLSKLHSSEFSAEEEEEELNPGSESANDKKGDAPPADNVSDREMLHRWKEVDELLEPLYSDKGNISETEEEDWVGGMGHDEYESGGMMSPRRPSYLDW